jgi:hypothetical protein
MPSVPEKAAAKAASAPTAIPDQRQIAIWRLTVTGASASVAVFRALTKR